jgi:hypothetical protein
MIDTNMRKGVAMVVWVVGWMKNITQLVPSAMQCIAITRTCTHIHARVRTYEQGEKTTVFFGTSAK